MQKSLLTIVLLIFSNQAMAQKYCATYQMPSKREDGKCFPCSELKGVYIKYWYFNGDKKITKKTKLTRNESQCITVNTTAPVTFQAFTVDKENIESKGSAQIQMGTQ